MDCEKISEMEGYVGKNWDEDQRGKDQNNGVHTRKGGGGGDGQVAMRGVWVRGRGELGSMRGMREVGPRAVQWSEGVAEKGGWSVSMSDLSRWRTDVGAGEVG